MTLEYQITIPEPLYVQLKHLADLRGQSIEAFVQATLAADLAVEEETAIPLQEMLPDPLLLVALTNPDQLLPPHGSAAEETLRQELGLALSTGPSLSTWLREERDAR